MAKFSHSYDLAFDILSDEEFAENITGEMLKVAIQQGINQLTPYELLEACSHYDTAEEPSP